MVLAKTLIFYCGKEYLSLAELITWTFWYQNQAKYPRSRLERPAEVHDKIWNRLSTGIFCRFRLVEQIAVTMVTDLREDLQEKEFLRQYYRRYYIQNCHATNPRDMVYGLLGILPMDIVPDYGKPVKDVYLDWIFSMANHLSPLAMIDHAGIRIGKRAPTTIVAPKYAHCP